MESCKKQIDNMKKAFKDVTTIDITTKKISNMAKNENKILEELRRRGGICEDPAPEVGGFTGWLISLFTKKK